MFFREMASIAVRPRRGTLLAFAAAALMLAEGCNHRRQSLRPIFSSPGAVAAPCTNCGTGSSEIIRGPSSGGSSGSLSSEPSSLEPADAAESNVPMLDPPAGGTPTVRRGTPGERTPSASIGGDPDQDFVPSQSTKPRSTSPSGKAPALQGPSGSSPTTWNIPEGRRAASTSGRVRQVSVRESLRPYLGESGEGELLYPNKADRPWKYVVLHHSANPTGNYDEIDAEHRKVLGYDGCGYHFVIGNGTGSADGQIEVARRWVNQKHGVHCRNAKSAEIDEYGIGICLVGDLDKEPPTPRQIAAARALVAYLSSRYDIKQSHVDTHSHLAATPTVCPGKHFPAPAAFAQILDAEPTATARRTVPTSRQFVRRPGSASY